MSGYGDTLRSLADQLGVRYETTPPAKRKQLNAFLRDQVVTLDRSLPPPDKLPRDLDLLRSVVVGLLDQSVGIPDHDNMHEVHEMEQFIAALEYECNCPDKEDMMRHVIRIDRRRDTIVTPAALAYPLVILAKEANHAIVAHIPHLMKHLSHCQSFQPEVDAVRLLKDALPAVVRLLVGDGKDGPRQAADWILAGEHPSSGRD